MASNFGVVDIYSHLSLYNVFVVVIALVSPENLS